jgi:hypothetical protein
VLPAGRITYRIKTLGVGRAKYRVMTPLELLARLAAVVPPPRYVPRPAARAPTQRGPGRRDTGLTCSSKTDWLTGRSDGRRVHAASKVMEDNFHCAFSEYRPRIGLS